LSTQDRYIISDGEGGFKNKIGEETINFSPARIAEGSWARCLKCGSLLEQMKIKEMEDAYNIEISGTTLHIEIIRKCYNCGHENLMVYASNIDEQCMIVEEKDK